MSVVHSCPRVLIAGLGGGSGKTIVSLGLARAFSEQGHRVQTFKKGPDYIDAKWLTLASHAITSNLDPFLLSSPVLQNLFWYRALQADISLIEGNRGLYDGKDVAGTYSSAELAKVLQCPVLIVADCTKVSRTMAALLLGLCVFDPEVNIQGVVLNRAAGRRHQTVLRQTIEQYTDLRVVGILPKLQTNPIPERNMGLVAETELETDPLAGLSVLVRDHVDLDTVWGVAATAPDSTISPEPIFFHSGAHPTTMPMVRIGVARDAALWFYYQENLDALRHAGAEIVEFSLLDDATVPEVHALYLGGGFPEIMAKMLAENISMKKSIRSHIEQGMPTYAECGGLMYLGRALEYNGVSYSMADAVPVATRVCAKPQGHGYVRAMIQTANPFFSLGSALTGHEFHYSHCPELPPSAEFVFSMVRGQGIAQGVDGILYRNCLAGYVHIHALGHAEWAYNFVAAAAQYKDCVQQGVRCGDIRLQGA